MARLSDPAVDLLARYADTHRDRRNIQTHLVGVPLVVFAVGVLLSVPAVGVAGLALTPAWGLWAVAVAWYLTRGRVGAGLAAALLSGLLVALAHRVPTGSTTAWLAWAVGAFVAGGLLQFAGHYYEGRRPPLSQDFVGLPVGPMFVAVELLAPLGFFRELAAEVERRAGPRHLRDLAHTA